MTIWLILGTALAAWIIYGIVKTTARLKAEEAEKRAKKQRDDARAAEWRAAYEQDIGKVRSVLFRMGAPAKLRLTFDTSKTTSDVYRGLVTELVAKKVPLTRREIRFFGDGWHGWYCDLVPWRNGTSCVIFDYLYRGDQKPRLDMSQFVEVDLAPSPDPLQSILGAIEMTDGGALAPLPPPPAPAKAPSSASPLPPPTPSPDRR